jgi:hypothetical protein
VSGFYTISCALSIHAEGHRRQVSGNKYNSTRCSILHDFCVFLLEVTFAQAFAGAFEEKVMGNDMDF